MKKYELIPTDGRKSFYGKAIVILDDKGEETLYSYNTPIIKRLSSGDLIKLWDGWTLTTGRHIKSFCGLNKAGFLNLESPCIPPIAANMTPEQSYKAMIARRYTK